MLLWVLPFFPSFLAILEELAPRLRGFYALWLFWNLDSMMLFGHLLAYSRFHIRIAPSFVPGVFDKHLRGFRRLWPRLLWCVLLRLLLFLHLHTSLI